MRHVTAVLLATALALSLAGGASAAAEPASAPAAARGVSGPVRPVGPPEFLPPAAAKSAAVAHGRIRPTTPQVGSPRLDPSTQFLRPARNGAVQVTVSGPAAEVSAQVRQLGGRVLVSVDGRSSVMLAKTELATLSSAPGVSAVTVSPKAYVDVAPAPGPSQGIAASGANTWLTSDSGAGVSIAIVDVGFSDLANQVNLGHLAPDQANRVTNENCVGSSGAASVDITQHGTAVAEIVHQMAPQATIYLYCVADSVGFSAAEQAIEGIPAIKIVSSSLGFPGDSRGDGTGAPGSAAATVERARKAGILWIQSAGNNGQDHWSGNLIRDPANGLIELNGTSNETDQVTVPNGGTAYLFLQWDQWPVSSAPLTLNATAYLCQTSPCTHIGPYALQQSPATDPVLDLPVTNTSGSAETWVISIGSTASLPSVRYDLSYWGDVSPSYLSQVSPVRAAAGSMAEPASSPYAFAVGAANVGADGTQPGTLEPFSSRGPTIDGRVKPDITGWDGVSSHLSDFSTGFYGTSAAAPHVAGAAALVAAANPGLDAAQLENFLEQRATNSHPTNPPSNATGYGLLTLGSLAGVAPPAGARYTPIAPTRILDTRTTTGGHLGALPGASTLTLPIHGLPSDVTAVAINLTGVGAPASTYLSAYPYGTAWPGTSNLNLSRTDPTAAVFAVVSVRNFRITIRNSAAPVNVVVDELGYFGTGGEIGKYAARQTPVRVLDTRTATGGHRGMLGNNATVTVNPGAPPGASAAVVNVTVTDAGSGGYVTAAPSCTKSSSTLNHDGYTRANLAIVKLSSTRTFCLVNSGASADVVVDVLGYIASAGAQYVALPAPQRIIDTRTGNGGSAGGQSSLALGSQAATVFYGSNVGVVPASATALLAGVVEATTSYGGYLTLYPGSTMPASPTSSLNFTPGRTVPNAVIVGLSSHQFGIYNSRGLTQVAMDLFGYFD